MKQSVYIFLGLKGTEYIFTLSASRGAWKCVFLCKLKFTKHVYSYSIYYHISHFSFSVLLIIIEP